MSISLEDKAHVIVTYNESFISKLPDISSGTEKVYYKGLSLRTPSWLSPEDASRRLVRESDSDVTESMELTPSYQFTPRLEEAMEFRYAEVEGVARDLRSKLKVPFRSEALDKEWMPF